MKQHWSKWTRSTQLFELRSSIVVSRENEGKLCLFACLKLRITTIFECTHYARTGNCVNQELSIQLFELRSSHGYHAKLKENFSFSPADVYECRDIHVKTTLA